MNTDIREIPRRKYLQALISRKHNRSIKVITGIRRVGKSYLLFEIFYRHLRESGIDDAHIIRIVLDNPDYLEFRKSDALYTYLKSCISDDKMYYILLDEVQMLENFEEVLNGLLYLKNVDVYVTGSNSKFLSKDVITEFRGRGDEIHVYPLTFQEFMAVYNGDKYDGWTDYITYGGLPGVLLREDEEEKIHYLQTLFTETYLKDIITRNRIRNDDELDVLIDIVSSAVGSLTNPLRISATFESVNHTRISVHTIKSYLNALEDAYLIAGVKRFDVRGRQYIGSPLKYYFEDVGLRNARLNFRQQEENYLMENIIFNELRYRGYSVDVGVVETFEKDSNGKSVRKVLEIDFVANKGSKRYYVQSAFHMPDAEKISQEKRSLVTVRDSFKKIIVVGDIMKLKRDNDGITTMSIYDFLLDDMSLDR
ncbi:MAG TPA: ATP-binding protein [Methanocorpusculum sp.]|nr:ATP-binding protein [Methanocorpusculum sp.]